MSISFTGNTAYGVRTTNLGASNLWTIAGWVRRNGANTGMPFGVATGGGSLAGPIIDTNGYAFIYAGYASYTQTNFQIADGEWVFLAYDGYTGAGYHYLRGWRVGDSSPTVIDGNSSHSAGSYTSSMVPAEVAVGWVAGRGGVSQSYIGSMSYVRYWNGANVSDANLTTEKNFLPTSGSPISNTSNSIASWPTSTGGAYSAIDWINGYNLTLNNTGSMAYSSSEPGIGSSVITGRSLLLGIG
jgi:hypothetical protein